MRRRAGDCRKQHCDRSESRHHCAKKMTRFTKQHFVPRVDHAAGIFAAMFDAGPFNPRPHRISRYQGAVRYSHLIAGGPIGGAAAQMTSGQATGGQSARTRRLYEIPITSPWRSPRKHMRRVALHDHRYNAGCSSDLKWSGNLPSATRGSSALSPPRSIHVGHRHAGHGPRLLRAGRRLHLRLRAALERSEGAQS